MAPKDEARYKALQDSYSKTTTWLIEQHRDEFNTHRKALLAEGGVDWSPPLTQEDRDAKALEEILARNPSLANLIPSTNAKASDPDPHS
jgi:hypothetical protein